MVNHLFCALSPSNSIFLGFRVVFELVIALTFRLISHLPLINTAILSPCLIVKEMVECLGQVSEIF
jgi:hypothetical protein